MENADDFVLRFAAAVYEAPPEEVARMITSPLLLMTPWFDLAVNDIDDLKLVLTTLRSGVSAAGVERMERQITSCLFSSDTNVVVTLDTQRFGASHEDLGHHRSTFVIESEGQGWRTGSLILANIPDETAVKTQLERRFKVRYWRSENTSWKPN